MPHHLTDEMRRCAEQCRECHEVCVETIHHCLEQGGRHVEAGHVRLLLDCAQICDTSGDFLLRGSDLHTETCRACAEVCTRCAESCERVGGDDVMKRCAEICRRCAESCRQMASVAAG